MKKLGNGAYISAEKAALLQILQPSAPFLNSEQPTLWRNSAMARISVPRRPSCCRYSSPACGFFIASSLPCEETRQWRVYQCREGCAAEDTPAQRTVPLQRAAYLVKKLGNGAYISAQEATLLKILQPSARFLVEQRNPVLQNLFLHTFNQSDPTYMTQ